MTLFDAIDEPVATSDDGTTYVRNNNKTSGSYFAQLTDTPAAFALMQSLTIDVRARTTGAVDDQTTLFAQVFQANGVTPLTNEVSVATNPGPGGFVTISGVTLTGLTGGSKAIWTAPSYACAGHTLQSAHRTRRRSASAPSSSTAPSEYSRSAPLRWLVAGTAGLGASGAPCRNGTRRARSRFRVVQSHSSKWRSPARGTGGFLTAPGRRLTRPSRPGLSGVLLVDRFERVRDTLDDRAQSRSSCTALTLAEIAASDTTI